MSRARNIVSIFEKDKMDKFILNIEDKMKRKLTDEEREELKAKFAQNVKGDDDDEVEEAVKHLEAAACKKKTEEEDDEKDTHPSVTPFVKSQPSEEDEEEEEESEEKSTKKSESKNYQKFCESNKMLYR